MLAGALRNPALLTPFPVLGLGGGAEPCEKPCRRQSARGGPRRRRCAAETWRALAGEAPGAEGLVSAGVSGLVWAVLPAPGQRPRRWPLKPGGTEPARPAHGEAAGARGEAAVPGAAQRPLLCSPPPGTAGPDADPAPAATPATGRRVAVPQQRHVSDPVGRADRRVHGGVRGPAAAASSLERAAPCRLLATEAGD